MAPAAGRYQRERQLAVPKDLGRSWPNLTVSVGTFAYLWDQCRGIGSRRCDALPRGEEDHTSTEEVRGEEEAL
jgi:hypothetical protein